MTLAIGDCLLKPQGALVRICISTAVLMLSGNSELLSISAAQNDDNETKTYVFLLNPECDYEFRDKFDYYLRLNNDSYEKYLGNYYVICLGGVSNLKEIEEYTIPQLRYLLPMDTFLFVYPDSMKEQYYDYIEDRYGYQYRYSALGNSDIPAGVAYSTEKPFNVKHEMAHLDTCGTWHDVEGNDTGQLVRHPDAEQFAWCLHALE